MPSSPLGSGARHSPVHGFLDPRCWIQSPWPWFVRWQTRIGEAIEKICVLEEIDASTMAALGLSQLQASSPEIDKTCVTTRQRFVLGKIDGCLLDLGIRLAAVEEKICTVVVLENDLG